MRFSAFGSRDWSNGATYRFSSSGNSRPSAVTPNNRSHVNVGLRHTPENMGYCENGQCSWSATMSYAEPASSPTMKMLISVRLAGDISDGVEQAPFRAELRRIADRTRWLSPPGERQSSCTVADATKPTGRCAGASFMPRLRWPVACSPERFRAHRGDD